MDGLALALIVEVEEGDDEDRVSGERGKSELEEEETG